jgi:hypothetical protein
MQEASSAALEGDDQRLALLLRPPALVAEGSSPLKLLRHEALRALDVDHQRMIIER